MKTNMVKKNGSERGTQGPSETKDNRTVMRILIDITLELSYISSEARREEKA